VDSTNFYQILDGLVIRAKAGDQKALADLRRYYKRFFVATIRRLIRRLPELERFKNDLEADVPTLFYEVVIAYDPELSYFSWYIQRFFPNAIVSHARKHYLKEACHLSVEQISKELIDDQRSDPFAKVLENKDLEVALATLGAKQRAAVELYFFEEMTQQQAAEQLGITQASFCKRLQRALVSLKDALS
jgi:RNA polymerase sigma factor (sigma-70 family)